MSIRTTCTCGKRIRAHDAFAGKEVECARCGKTVRIPVPPPPVKRLPSGVLEVPCVCGRVLRARPELAGRRVACPQCKKPVTIPSDEPPPVAEAPIAADLGLSDLGLSDVGSRPMPNIGGPVFAEEVIPDAIMQAGVAPAAIPRARSGGKSGFQQTTLVIALIGGGFLLVAVMLCTGALLLLPKLLASLGDEISVELQDELASASLPWQLYESKDSGYSVLLPGVPKLADETAGLPSAPVPTKLASIDLGNRAFVVSVGQLVAAGGTVDEQAVLNGAVLGVTGEHEASSTNQEPLLLSGHRGVAVSFKTDHEGKEVVMRHRFYLADGRLYSLLYVARFDADSEAEAAKFLDSFQFLE